MMIKNPEDLYGVLIELRQDGFRYLMRTDEIIYACKKKPRLTIDGDVIIDCESIDISGMEDDEFRFPYERCDIVNIETEIFVVSKYIPAINLYENEQKEIEGMRSQLTKEGFRWRLRLKTIEYLSRSGTDGGTIECYRQARWCLDKLIQEMKG